MRHRLSRLLTPWVVMPLVAAVVLAGWWLLRGDTRSSAADGVAIPTEQVVEATLGSVNLTVSAEGTIAYARSEDLSFTASGTVTAVHVVAGQTVQAGEVLAELDSPELEAAVAEAQTSVAEAAATVADGEADGASDVRQAANRSALATAQDRLASAQDSLDGATLTASIDGTVAEVDITVGEQLVTGGTGGTTMTGSGSGSGQTRPGVGSSSGGAGSQPSGTSTTSPHIRVVSEGEFVVDLGLDGTDVAQIAVGQEAQIELSSSSGSGGFPGFGGGFPGGGGPPGFSGGGFPDLSGGRPGSGGGEEPGVISGVEAATGEVVEVSTIADASSGVATFPVTVTFTDDTGAYHAGANAAATITYAERTDAVLIPSFAVTTEGTESTVTVEVDGTREERAVTTGLTSGAMVEITSGLRAGESVVISFQGRFGGGPGGPDQQPVEGSDGDQ